MSQVTQQRLEKAKQELLDLHAEDPEKFKNDLVGEEVGPPPFGGGHLVGLMVNPSSLLLQNTPGYDSLGFSHSRSYGGSTYKPLVDYCKSLIESGDPVSEEAGRAHLGDKFMVRRHTAEPFTPAEQAMYDVSHDIGQQLLDKGAAPPIAFPKVEVLGHFGPEVLPGHYIPSCGKNVSENDIISAFMAFMSKPGRWVLP